MQKHLEFNSNGLTLRGYVHIPDLPKDKFPLVVIFHGFTGNKVDANFYILRISRALEKRGIASLRFDFGNSGESDGDFKNMTPSGEIQDGINIIDYAKTLPNIDYTNIALAGFSMGGMVASIVANIKKEDIKALCLGSPAGNMEDILGKYFNNDEEIGEVNNFSLSRAAYEDMKRIDPYKRAKGFDKEVLLIHGTSDDTVPFSCSKRYKEEVYKDKAILHTLKDADHCYTNVAWYEELLETICNFFEKNLQK